jgi:hypothetical protein
MWMSNDLHIIATNAHHIIGHLSKFLYINANSKDIVKCCKKLKILLIQTFKKYK